MGGGGEKASQDVLAICWTRLQTKYKCLGELEITTEGRREKWVVLITPGFLDIRQYEPNMHLRGRGRNGWMDGYHQISRPNVGHCGQSKSLRGREGWTYVTTFPIP